ncbi:predicted protein [Histoplasma mississippiense (nom. inval.)]|nr:predicted protein [Histoplasma mississippiense (nom. inval.)]EDN05320.1 predicted protein [Histoplasma mississippiense (nom. inval.)]
MPPPKWEVKERYYRNVYLNSSRDMKIQAAAKSEVLDNRVTSITELITKL